MIRIRRVRQQAETELERYRSKGTMASKKWRTSKDDTGISFNYYTHILYYYVNYNLAFYTVHEKLIYFRTVRLRYIVLYYRVF